MNCHKCGHNKDVHKVFSDGLASCVHDPGEGFPLCGCSRTPKGIERDLIDAELAAWKAEALAAREYIKMLERYMGAFFGDEISITVDEMDSELEVYRAAKVKDVQP